MASICPPFTPVPTRWGLPLLYRGGRTSGRSGGSGLTLEKQLSDEDIDVTVLGTYPRCAFNEPRLRAIGIIGGTGQMGGWFENFRLLATPC